MEKATPVTNSNHRTEIEKVATYDMTAPLAVVATNKLEVEEHSKGEHHEISWSPLSSNTNELFYPFPTWSGTEISHPKAPPFDSGVQYLHNEQDGDDYGISAGDLDTEISSSDKEVIEAAMILVNMKNSQPQDPPQKYDVILEFENFINREPVNEVNTQVDMAHGRRVYSEAELEAAMGLVECQKAWVGSKMKPFTLDERSANIQEYYPLPSTATGEGSDHQGLCLPNPENEDEIAGVVAPRQARVHNIQKFLDGKGKDEVKQ
jgi:hypothetical protein